MDLRLVPPSQQRLWADEVLYLHSLWHQSPSQNPTPEAKPNPNLAPINSTEFKKKKRYRKRRKNQAQPSDPPPADLEWPVNPSPVKDDASAGWPEPAVNAQRLPPQPTVDAAKANALSVQYNALRSCRDFFVKDGSDVDDEMSEDEDEEESKAFDFFLGLFQNDGDLRGYYEKYHEKGEFLCLVCGGSGVKLGRKYWHCVGLVQHSNQIFKTKTKAAHRGFGRAVCRVLGWDTTRLPNIVLDTVEPLGKSLIKAAEMQDEKQKDDGIEIILIPDTDDVSRDAQKDDDNGNLIDCIQAKETEVLNTDDIKMDTQKDDDHGNLIDCIQAKETEVQKIDDVSMDTQKDEDNGNLIDCIQLKETELPNADDISMSAQKDDDNGNLIDCIQAKEIEVPNREGLSCGKELLTELGKHPEGSKKKKRKRKKVAKNNLISNPFNPPVAQVVWPCDPTISPKQDHTGGQDLTQAMCTSQPRQPPSIEGQEKTTTVQFQQDALKACQNFLAKSDDSSSDHEDDEEEMEKRESVAFKYFLKLFEMDHNLRKYYEAHSLKGDFCCLVCGGIGKKTLKMFGDCIGLVQHSKSIGKMTWAHRAFGRAVCEVLAWDIDENPSIIISPKKPVSQSLEKAVQDATTKDGNDHS